MRPAIELGGGDGLRVRLLPDRTLDCGAAWFAGVPIAWLSGIGEVGPLESPSGEDFRRSWGGGLVTTCGLRNVGAPSEGHPLHGAVHNRRATVDGLTAVVHDGPLELTRAWRIDHDSLSLRDVVRNRGEAPEPAPFLYHVNFGPPFWAPGARLDVAAGEILPRDADAAAFADVWDQAPPLRPGEPERVYEHRAPRGRVAITGAGLEVVVTWTGLERLHQWIHPGVGALGIEPANCSVMGRAHDRAEGRLPVLAPGESHETDLHVNVKFSATI